MDHDTSIIRPQMRMEDVRWRGLGMDPERLRAIRKGLLTLHSLEMMAVNIYRYQITREKSELNRELIAAMCNEMTHLQDFQVKLFEFGQQPRWFRWLFWIVGFAYGWGSRILGRKMILRADVWGETKAVRDYGKLLDSVDWDPDTRAVIERDQSDERGHADRWNSLLQSAGP